MINQTRSSFSCRWLLGKAFSAVDILLGIVLNRLALLGYQERTIGTIEARKLGVKLTAKISSELQRVPP